MATVQSVLYYSASSTPLGAEDDWLIDGLSHPPDVVLNFQRVATPTTIYDLRCSKTQPTLAVMGFEKITSPSRVDHRSLSDGSQVALTEYRAETAALLQALTRADDVVVFDATLRREDTEAPSGAAGQSAHLRVHVDQNPRSARTRAINHGGPERRFRRFQIVNVWRPLLDPVRNYHLALCDYRSLDVSGDLVATTLRFPAWLKDAENYSVKYNSRHRWYYWDSLAPDEAIVFKCYDSACAALAARDESDQEPGDLVDLAGLCPHTAFFNADGPTTGRLRVSEEIRALLFYV